MKQLKIPFSNLNVQQYKIQFYFIFYFYLVTHEYFIYKFVRLFLYLHFDIPLQETFDISDN